MLFRLSFFFFFFMKSRDSIREQYGRKQLAYFFFEKCFFFFGKCFFFFELMIGHDYFLISARSHLFWCLVPRIFVHEMPSLIGREPRRQGGPPPITMDIEIQVCLRGVRKKQTGTSNFYNKCYTWGLTSSLKKEKKNISWGRQMGYA